MRVAVNARRLEGQRLGVARYIEYLLQHWAGLVDPSDEIVLFLRTPLPPDDALLRDSFRVEVLRPRLTGLTWENVVLARKARSADVLFGPSYTVPLTRRGRSVVAIHSVNEARSEAHGWSYGLTYGGLYRRSAAKAARVIVPAHSTLEEVRTIYRIPREKIVVVPLGADESFRPIDDKEALQETRRRYLGSDRPYVVFVGKLSERRNVRTLVEAFAEVKRRTGLPHALLLFGPNHLGIPVDRVAAEAGIADSVVQRDGSVERHAELALVYNAADAFVSASAYEGFSLPLVEALACGRPAVVPDRGALGEIAGDAALLVAEPSAEALADAVQRVLTDESLRKELSARATKRARAFRWDEAARRTLDVLREVAAS